MLKAALLAGNHLMGARNNLELAEASPVEYVAQQVFVVCLQAGAMRMREGTTSINHDSFFGLCFQVGNLVRRAMKDSKATDKTKEMGRMLLTELEEAATVEVEYVNDEGNPVKLSPDPAHAHKYYCGQKRPIPGSDGRCGPTNGPQCPSCVRFTGVTRKSQPEHDSVAGPKGMAAGFTGLRTASPDLYV